MCPQTFLPSARIRPATSIMQASRSWTLVPPYAVQKNWSVYFNAKDLLNTPHICLRRLVGSPDSARVLSTDLPAWGTFRALAIGPGRRDQDAPGGLVARLGNAALMT